MTQYYRAVKDIVRGEHCVAKAGAVCKHNGIYEQSIMYLFDTGACIPVNDGEIQPTPSVGLAEAFQILKNHRGHHCTMSGMYQFNIKYYGGWEAPKKVQDMFNADEIYEEFNRISEDYLRLFVSSEDNDASLQSDYSWIEDWHTDGRMGGWLVLQTDIERDLDMLESAHFYASEEAKPEDRDAWMKDVADKAIDLAMDMKMIDTRVRTALNDFKSYMDDEDSWTNLLEQATTQTGEVVIQCPHCHRLIKQKLTCI